MKKHICTDCGKPGATLFRRDAAGEAHWFHAECWREAMRWLVSR